MKIALVVEYDGTNYKGFQYQSDFPTIQEEIEKAIHKFTGESLRVSGAGRTDAGVHALGQVVSFKTLTNHSTDTIVNALNFYLPGDIAVKSARMVDDRFDPRRCAISRKYRYTIVSSLTRSPLRVRTAFVMRGALDLNFGAMETCIALLKGSHDFTRFAGKIEKGKSAYRKIYTASIESSVDKLIFDFEGSSFLPHQVRRMVGALVDVGRGNILEIQFKAMLKGAARPSSRCLPAEGLCLVGVNYSEDVSKGEE
ncbi:MAG: tRNA pseudouridine(38-40) synthase TruA [Chloroflexota bacterium]|nr:tRNA pseudouridine(38-40) synthase TruA [Chloroflexota bacterium]